MPTPLSSSRAATVLCIIGLHLIVASVLHDYGINGRWLEAGTLLALAVAWSGTRFQIQSVKGAIGLPDIFIFGAVIAVPLFVSPALAAITPILAARREPAAARRSSGVEVRLVVAALAAVAARVVYGRFADGLGMEAAGLMTAAIVYLTPNALVESLSGRAIYWRMLLRARTWSAVRIGIFFAPAAAAAAVLADVSVERQWDPFLGTLAPVAVFLYGLLEWRLGPTFEDSRQRNAMEGAYLRTVEALALAVEAKDQVSSTHLKRVQCYSMALGRALNCNEAELRALEFGSLLHDIGKVAVPEELLTKPSRLSPEEFSQVASHVEIGAEILAAADLPFPVSELVRCHHENWDGSGYPRGLKGDRIPLTARILSTVDSFDALTTDRPYRSALTTDRALEIIRERRGSAFDPEVVDALLRLLPSIEAQLARDPDFQRATLQPGPLHKRVVPDAVQTSLTQQERIESLKQSRTVARQRTTALEGTALKRLLTGLAPGLSRREIGEFVMAILSERIEFDEAGLFVVKGSYLTPIHFCGRKSEMVRHLRIPLDDSPTGWVASNGRTLLNGNAGGESGELGTIASLLGLRAVLAAPLWARGQVMGTINLYSREAGAYAKQHSGILEEITFSLGPLLMEAAFYEDANPPEDDATTGFPAARKVLREMRSKIEEAARDGNPLLSFCVDVDHFRTVNVRHGHDAGDNALRDIAGVLRATLPGFDFGRIGPDRFVCSGQLPSHSTVSDLIGSLDSAIERCFDRLSRRFDKPLTVSTGWASYPRDGKCAESLLLLAQQRSLERKQDRLVSLVDRGRPHLPGDIGAAAAV